MIVSQSKGERAKLRAKRGERNERIINDMQENLTLGTSVKSADVVLEEAKQQIFSGMIADLTDEAEKTYPELASYVLDKGRETLHLRGFKLTQTCLIYFPSLFPSPLISAILHVSSPCFLGARETVPSKRSKLDLIRSSRGRGKVNATAEIQ